MTIRLELRQVSTVEPGEDEYSGPLYRVLNTVEYVDNIPRDIFVMNVDTGQFEHVATLWHMKNIPDTKEEAIRLGGQYYRDYSAYREYDTVSTALDFASYTRIRVEGLVNVYAQSAGSFPGVFDYTFIEE